MGQLYTGSCHCGAVRFAYEGEPIKQGLRCTCSICRRKGALMSAEVIPLDQLQIQAADEDVGLYQFGNKAAKHYFCRKCGIYTHNETLRMPGHARVNLGCIDDLDSESLEVVIFDGKNKL